MKKIVVKRQHNDGHGMNYRAILEDTPGVFGEGQTAHDAIGSLVFNYSNLFNIVVESE